jgi:hypothetical protein
MAEQDVMKAGDAAGDSGLSRGDALFEASKPFRR